MAGFSLDKVYVRSRRVAGKTPCAAEFAAMLACWSSRGDLVNVGACAETATALSSCMQAKGGPAKLQKSTINWHLRKYYSKKQ